MELKEIAPYLAYGLKFVIGDIYDTDLRGNIATVLALHSYQKKVGRYYCVTEEYLSFCPNLDENIKFIFHPLSDLTKPCLEGGKIPIVELCYMAGFKSSDRIITHEDGVVSCRLMIDPEYKGVLTPCSFSFDNTEIIFKAISTTWHSIQIKKQQDLISWLYEHHFWLGDQDRFGKDIIDINSLK